MKLYSRFFLVLLIITSCNRLPFTEASRPLGYVDYTVTYKGVDNNTFQVTVNAPVLGHSNNIFQFAATAPGTYQVMDIGRFVSDFKAFDAKGSEIQTTKTSTNQYEISEPVKLQTIQYSIQETWDTEVDEHQIYRMCGTSIESDHVLFNPHCVLGYFKGLQAMPIQLHLQEKKDWLVGSALQKNSAGAFTAKNYDFLVDSPIMMGRLSKATANVNETAVDIFTYSVTDRIKSNQILESMGAMLKASDLFLEGLPVDRYVFLFHFENSDRGAWEHSYSSEYVYRENDWTLLEERIMATAAHEFFHIVTPLNIHSEIIEQFNFVNPTPSQHLWLYEGVTEWASDMILLHGGQIDMQEYLNRHQRKLILDEKYYDQSYSLTDLGETSFTKAGQKQFGNVYSAGALVSGLLDIYLLELSEGKRGLRELIVELANAYGPERPFSEDNFFDELVRLTYPEIETFIDKYIIGTEELPIADYYNIIGVDYFEKFTDSLQSGLGFTYRSTDQGLNVVSTAETVEVAALQKGDFISAINGVSVNRYTVTDFLASFEKMPVGTSYDVELFRMGKTHNVKCQTVHKVEYHLLRPSSSPTAEQLALRNKWMGRY